MALPLKTSIRAAIVFALLGARQINAAGVFKVPFTSTLASNFAGFFSRKAPLTNAALKIVTAVQAGNHQIFNNVLIDTGSAILWVGNEQEYIQGPYTQITNETFSVGYGAGGVSGPAYIDRVTVGDATVNSQIIGDANRTVGFALEEPMDGILGLGPSGSNYGEVSGHNTTPTFVENLVSEGVIDKALFGIYISPLSENGIPEGTGEITFGGIDESRIEGEYSDISWLDQNKPLDFHWEFNASSFSWGDQVLAAGQIYARTDTGFLPLGVPNDGYFAIIHSVPGSTVDTKSAIAGCVVFPSNMTADNLPAIEIGVGNLNFTIPATRYIVPPILHASLNITDDNLTHTWIAPAGPDMFDLGQVFLEGAYSAYDMENHLVGFAHLA